MMNRMSHTFNLMTDYRRLGELLDFGATFCAFDTETTGLDAESGRVIELGAVKFSRDGEIGTFRTLLDPLMPIPPEATRVNHITDGMVRGMPSERDVMPQFVEFSRDAVLVAHNAQFDLRFVNAALLRLGLGPLQNRAVDTLRLSRAAFPDAGRWRLGALAARLSIDAGNAHRALDDALVCMKVFLSAAERLRPKCG